MNQADPNPEYWSEYSNLQHVKHELIRHCLNGWFPKMALGRTACGRLLYIDTHAGRGKHLNGQLGSPLVALTTLLGHQKRDQMLENAEIRFYFIERDADNLAALKEELATRPNPNNVFVEAKSGDYVDIIESALADIESDGEKMAPGFLFVDPYGFKLPGKLLRKLLSYPKVELFMNVIWRELDMAIQQFQGGSKPKRVETERDLFSDEDEPSPDETKSQRRAESRVSLEARLTTVFDGTEWRQIDAEHSDDRAEQCADLFRMMTGARWGTHLRMLDNGRVRYFLLHLTNHDAGRDLMKDCMWKACPEGGFSASKEDNPRQKVFIQAEPDLGPLRQWIIERLGVGSTRWQVLADALRVEWWQVKHLNESLRDMRKTGLIEAKGVFGPKQNPLISLQVH